MKIGRRPVYLLGTIFNLIGCIMGGFQKTVQVYFGVNILTGFGAAPVDSLVEISTTDIFFAHERGTRLSLYIFTIYAGSYLGPVAAGYIAESQSWRWCFWYLVILFGIILIVQIFTMEESTFRRPPPEPTISRDQAVSNSSEESMPKIVEAGIIGKKPHSVIPSETSPETDSAQPPPTMTYRQRMAFIHTEQNDPRPWWLIAIRPFSLITLPAVIWAGLVYGVQIMWLSLLATTQSEIFGAPPYNFSVAAVGDTNFAAFIGGIFGMLLGGFGSDKCLLYLARRNGGIAEPEMRLWTMIPPALINMAGLLMYGVGAANGQPWIVSAGFGTSFIGFGIGSGGAIAITYAIDCYPRIASESLVLMLFVRNLLGTGFTFAIQPWLNVDGLKNTSIIMAMMCLVANMSFLIMTVWGKRMRKMTAGRYLRMAEKGNSLL